MLETPVGFLGQEDPLAKGQAIHYSILGRPCGSAGKESTHNVGDWVLSLDWEDLLEEGKATHFSILESPEDSPENPHGEKSLVGYSQWSHKESDTTE